MALVQFALCPVIGRVPTEGSNPRVRAFDKIGFYQDQIVPLLINWSMRQKNLAAYRTVSSRQPRAACSKSASVPDSTCRSIRATWAGARAMELKAHNGIVGVRLGGFVM